MSVFESILYSFISGIAEFLPVSSRAHQSLMRHMFGQGNNTYLADLIVHIGVLLAVFVGFRDVIFRLHRERKAMSMAGRRRFRSLDGKSVYDLRLLKSATIPLLIGLCLYPLTRNIGNRLLALMFFLIVNGSFLLVAAHSRQGNRSARSMTGLDGITIGLVGATSVLPGISRTGMISVFSVFRGADNQNATNWAIMLSIPALALAIVFDLIGLVFVGGAVFAYSAVGGCLLTCAGAFCGGYLGIRLFQMILNHSGFSGFAYYSFGAAFFSFILYLIT